MTRLSRLIILSALALFSCSQPAEKKRPANKNIEAYTLPILPKWTTETFPVPPSFASSIPYRGIEDIRFAPGWGNSLSKDYWTYVFLWHVEGPVQTDTASIETYLESYYTGLVNSNVQKYHIPKAQLIPIKASVKKAATMAGDTGSYHATIQILDYMTQQPMVLNCIIHIKDCQNTQRSFLLHEISPKRFSDSIWNDLNKINEGFECPKQ